MKKKGLFILIICSLLGILFAQEPDYLASPMVLGEMIQPSREQGEILINQDNGQELSAHNEHSVFYPASTTKILTALVVIQNEDLGRVVTVGDEINSLLPDASRAGLYIGEKITVRELLYALMLPSGNDAAYTLAVDLGRSLSNDKSMNSRDAITVFVALMNRTAQDLGAQSSHFINPDGYHHPDHYSTACDMALIAREAMQNPDFQQIVETRAYPAPEGVINENKQVFAWENTNRLLNKNDPYYLADVTGIKTGHTSQAGYCLVSSASRQGRNLIAVVLNSTEPGVLSSSIRLLEYGFSIEQSEFIPGEQTKSASNGEKYFKYCLIIIGFIYLYRLLFRRNKRVSSRKHRI